MAKNSGSVRANSRSTVTSSYAKGGTFNSSFPAWERERQMNQDLRSFGEQNGYSNAFGGGLMMRLNDTSNVRSYDIQVETLFSTDGTREVKYRTLLAEYRAPVNDNGRNQEYYDMAKSANAYFDSIEQADKHIKSVTAKMNKYKIK